MKYLIEMQPGGNRALAFGLTWHSTLGNDPEAVAAKIASRAKAAAYTRGGARSTVVGLLHVKKRSELPRRRIQLYSAAAMFARTCARGPVALRMKMPSGVWVAAAYDGVVMVGSDVIHDSDQQAQAYLAHLQEKHKGLIVYGDQDGDQQLPPTALAGQLDASTQLKRTTRTYAQIPLPIWGILAALLAWAATDYSRSWYQSSQKLKKSALTQTTLSLDPSNSWQAAIHTWASQMPNHGGQVLQTLLYEVEKVPLTAGRWELVEVDCHPTQWRCSARYRRGHLGTNLELREALPEPWSLQWPDLQNAVAQMPLSQPSPAAALNWEHLPANADVALSWLSGLQRLAPALTDLAVGHPQEVALTPPTQIRPDGTAAAIPFPVDSELRIPTARTLVLNGPMRSLYLLSLPNGTLLDRLQIRRLPIAAVGLDNSALTVTLTGKIHAK